MPLIKKLVTAANSFKEIFLIWWKICYFDKRALYALLSYFFTLAINNTYLNSRGFLFIFCAIFKGRSHPHFSLAHLFLKLFQ